MEQGNVHQSMQHDTWFGVDSIHVCVKSYFPKVYLLARKNLSETLSRKNLSETLSRKNLSEKGEGPPGKSLGMVKQSQGSQAVPGVRKL